MTCRICSWSKRLKRLEKLRQKEIRDTAPMAIVELCDFPCGETHLVQLSPGRFKAMPGPGPQIDNFGYFEPVVYMTSDEMRA
jgi:hypothetical protein